MVVESLIFWRFFGSVFSVSVFWPNTANGAHTNTVIAQANDAEAEHNQQI